MSIVGNFQVQNPDRDGVPVRLSRPLTNHNQEYDERTGDNAPELSQAETMAQREQGVAELARQLTRQSTRYPDNIFDYQEGSDLDPFSENFNAKKYTKGLAKMSQGAGVERLAGIAYRNMSVHGFGSDAGECGPCAGLVAGVGSEACGRYPGPLGGPCICHIPPCLPPFSLHGANGRLFENSGQYPAVHGELCTRPDRKPKAQSADLERNRWSSRGGRNVDGAWSPGKVRIRHIP